MNKNNMPSSAEAEDVLLGAIMYDSSIYNSVIGYINEDVSFTFHLTGDYYVKKMFDAWSNVCLDPDTYTVPYDEEYKSDVIIQQLNEQNLPIYGIKLRNAFPIQVAGIELNNNSTDTTQKLNVTLAYDDFTPEGAMKSLLGGVKGLFGSLNNII